MTATDANRGDGALATINDYCQRLRNCDSSEEAASVAVEAARAAFDAESVTVVERRTTDESQGELTVLASSHDDEPDVSSGESGGRLVDVVLAAVDDGHSAVIERGDDTAADTPLSTVGVPAIVDDETTVVLVSRVERADAELTPIEPLRTLVGGLAGTLEAIRARERLAAKSDELQRQVQRLDEFASVISHDVRSPLDVIHGQLDMAQAEGDDKYFELAENAVDRVEEIVSESVQVARKGQPVTDTEPLSAGELAETTWRHVDTADATIKVETSRSVHADKMRLLRAFEQLFVNAVEHAGDHVTVSVGDLESGFYVSDDGPGVPEGDRERVFEMGYSTAEEAAGFGLALARACIEAHGWTITLTESDAGGARFEISGVEPAV